MKLITIILSYFNEDKEDIYRHLNNWNNFSESVKDQVSFIIVDDCSKIPINKMIDNNNLDLSLYRILDDIKWNTSGVRNLGALQANTPYLLILDMDTVVDSNIIEQIIEICNNNINKSIFFDFNRIVVNDANHPKNNQNHPAVCLIRKQDYWSVNGCDEDLSGNYGYTSNLFKIKLLGNNIKQESLRNISILYYAEAQKDNLDRNRKHNRNLFDKKRKNNKLPKKLIRFNWKKI